MLLSDATVAELAYALGLGSSAERHAGSTPARRTLLGELALTLAIGAVVCLDGLAEFVRPASTPARRTLLGELALTLAIGAVVCLDGLAELVRPASTPARRTQIVSRPSLFA